ncbi:hypothetical protein Fuma_01890 [Fuerstiella marisgermanici]|uniref:Uncharacterized protein n=1 Tax=Fuerstiella marisgermanici TaxID=1891926 RepID=A0A1P8WDZ8_9PLAN|nr:hypothetical protein Fuma_01890 [Fuerstiella marisgermanici]
MRCRNGRSSTGRSVEISSVQGSKLLLRPKYNVGIKRALHVSIRSLCTGGSVSSCSSPAIEFVLSCRWALAPVHDGTTGANTQRLSRKRRLMRHK